ncbi:MAG: hypothetical protein WBX00_28640 [Isosphaeraceae bacterium]|jgi:hypothetical protein
MIDLWPKELSTVDQRSPLTILKEQASLLGEKTQNIVIAVLANYDMFGPSTVSGYPFKYGFVLTCPALGNYRFRLFSIGYDIYMYPVCFDLDSDVLEEIVEDTHVELGKDGIFQASNEEEFIEILKRIFSSRKALQVIRALLSQAKS